MGLQWIGTSGRREHGATAGRVTVVRAIALAALLIADGRADAGGAAVTIDAPAEGAVVPASVRVVGRVPVLSEGQQAVLRVNGKDVAFEGGRFATTLVAPDGPLRIRAVFAELGDPAQAVERSVIVDATAPVIELEQPVDEIGEFPGGEGIVRGVARDPHLVRVRLNDKDVAFDEDGVFEALFLLPPKASMEVKIEAIDVVGNASIARRILRRGEGSAETPPVPPPAAGTIRAAVEGALRWLVSHQSPDGRWESEGFARWCDGKPARGEGPDGRGKAQYHVGVTGLAVLTFVRAGYSERSDGPMGKAVADGLRFLRSAQDTDGCFGARSSGHFIYNHAIATAAVVEAYGATRAASLAGPAARGVAFAALARNRSGAWRYGIQPGDSDTSVTGWMAAALAAANVVNAEDRKRGRSPPIVVDVAALPAAVRWVDAMTDPATGRVGYQQRGTGPARPTELVDKFPAEKSESMTAVGLLVRLLAGEDPKAQRSIAQGAALCASVSPSWDPNSGLIDFYYWYHATRALAIVGGAPWSTWRPRLVDAVLPQQRADGDSCGYRGSWDPIDPWGPDGGRVYSTAMVALALLAADAVPTKAIPPDLQPPAPIAPTPPDVKARLRVLRDRGSKWVTLRQVCLDNCAQCDGRGSVRGGRCSRCLGLGKTFNARLRDAYLLMRSPAWRADPRAGAEFQAYYKRVWQREEASPALRHFRFGEITLVDETHGIVPVFENGADLATPSQWVWSEEPAFPKGTWYLYTEAVDGPWP